MNDVEQIDRKCSGCHMPMDDYCNYPYCSEPDDFRPPEKKCPTCGEMTRNPILSFLEGDIPDELEKHCMGSISQKVDVPIIHGECSCGEGFSGTDQQEIKAMWSEHVAAKLRQAMKGMLDEAG